MAEARPEPEWTTVHVSNLPLDTHRVQLENAFSHVGPIKKCFTVKGRDGAKSTLGFVTFALGADARSAIELEDVKLGDNILKLKLAPNTKLKDRKPKKTTTAAATEEDQKPVSLEDKTAARANPRKARLIIRNLSFKATDNKIKAVFGKFGELAEINILKKPDGKMVGCAFLQFKNVNSAIKTIKEMNAKPFLGRPVAVDWAVPKEVFKGAAVKEEEVKTEIKEEDIKDEPESEAEVKEEEDDDEDEDDEDDDDDDVEEDSEDDKDEDNCDDDDDNNDVKGKDFKGVKTKVPHNLSTGHDVEEGKTVFIKNLAYETDEEDLRDMMEEIFGPVHFAKLVMDKVMNHPRGTAFVKFRQLEDAVKCVEVSEGRDGLFLDKRQLNCCLAIQKEKVESLQKERKTREVKDKRNLYLAREGMIREGTAAAVGLSASDLAKRAQVERHKKNMLKNLNMFVSTTRLCIRNLPASYDDKKLRTLFAENAPRNARITEAKVIRDMKQMKNGVGLSKQYAFVSFARHLDALGALRNLNNNPDTFGNDHRPIVDFSIENKKAVDARQKREAKSKLNNPNYKGGAAAVKKNRDKNTNKKADNIVGQEETTGKKPHMGTLSDPKVKSLPKHTGAKVRHDKPKISRKDLRKREEERKNPKKRKREQSLRGEPSDSAAGEAKKKKKTKKPPSKADRRDEKENKAFDNLVSQYKNKFATEASQQVLKKWFDT